MYHKLASKLFCSQEEITRISDLSVSTSQVLGYSDTSLNQVYVVLGIEPRASCKNSTN